MKTEGVYVDIFAFGSNTDDVVCAAASIGVNNLVQCM